MKNFFLCQVFDKPLDSYKAWAMALGWITIIPEDMIDDAVIHACIEDNSKGREYLYGKTFSTMFGDREERKHVLLTFLPDTTVLYLLYTNKATTVEQFMQHM